MVCVLRGPSAAQGQEKQGSACCSFVFPKTNCWLYFPRGSGAWAEGCVSPLGRTWTSPANDEFDPDDSAVGNNVLRKAFRKPFV